MHVQFDTDHSCAFGSYRSALTLDCASSHRESSLRVLERCGEDVDCDFGVRTEVVPPLDVACCYGPHSAWEAHSLFASRAVRSFESNVERDDWIVALLSLHSCHLLF